MKPPERNTSLRIDAIHKALQTETNLSTIRRLLAHLRKLERNIK